jgi:adenosylcobinamide-GDP ribazoletransferase
VTNLPAASLGDALRFAFGTLTVLPARLTRWDRPAARGGMLAAPLVGAVVGLSAAACGGLLVALGAGPLLAAVGTVAAPAVLTRALHLDGLADTADALGSGKEAEDALRIMKQSDIGPFGVVVLVFTLLAQVASAAACYAHGWVYGGAAALVSAVAARVALLVSCRRGVPAARPGGLGAAVAGSVPRWAALGSAALYAALAAAGGAGFGGLTPLRFGCAVLLGTAAGELLVRRCTRRLGGVTGDVFGAVTESAATLAFLTLALR